MEGRQNVIEVTLFAEGYFDFSSNNPAMFQAAIELMNSIKDSKLHLLPSNKDQMQFLRFIPTEKNYVISFGRGVITIAFISRSPNDVFIKEIMEKHISKVFSLINEKFELKFSSFKVEKDSVFTGLNPLRVNNAFDGNVISKRFGEYSDWELALHKRIPNTHILEDNVELLLSKRISSSTLLINGERVVSTYFTFGTDPSNRAARYSCSAALPFYNSALEMINKEEKDFNSQWRNN